MAMPQLTFFCELDSAGLQSLFTDALIADLSGLNAGVSLGILDHSPERAELVRRLNQAGIPVTAWLLLPREQGYWFNLRNAADAVSSYRRLRDWTEEHGLVWQAVGLDIEPDIRDLKDLTAARKRLLPRLLKRAVRGDELRAGQQAYRDLVDEIRADGHLVESYQFFLIADERSARSTLVQRVTGIVDVPVDREVWMLYTSFWRSPELGRGNLPGPGVLCSYGAEAEAIGLGSTGGGVETLVGDPRPLNWDEFARDLRLAYSFTDRIYIFSLEGCVRQGFLERLKDFAWDQPMLLPDTSTVRVNDWRRAFQGVLWIGSHLQWISLVALGITLGLFGLRRWLRARRSRELTA